ncbi:BIR7B-like protein [Mya arenaria]|uniref:BIR7B-like protein n=2 Tax=Mya arenaria TaxID=6604 RepID=A0ABY7EDM0_MYAAR|nr:BIR7B-like protein [Mya arenaria]
MKTQTMLQRKQSNMVLCKLLMPRNPMQRTLEFTADEPVKILVGRKEREEPIPDNDTDPDWSDGDEPLFEHTRHSPNCLFLKELLREQLLNTNRTRPTQQRARRVWHPGMTTLDQRSGTFKEWPSSNGQQPETLANAGFFFTGSEPCPAQQLNRQVLHPGMTTLAQRLGTFNEWPQSTGQQPEALAEAGLFFTGINDLCRCFTCDGGLQRWDREDDPGVEHARSSPDCRYVREMKGQRYINMVHPAAQREQLEDCIDIQGQHSSGGITKYKSAIINVHRRGYAWDRAHKAAMEYMRRGRSLNNLVADDLQAILEERDTPLSQEVLLEENERLKRRLKCSICHRNQVKVLFLPCGHLVACENCAPICTHCPRCQTRITHTFRVFMS